MKSLHLITTGGTIDSVWDGREDTAVPSAETVVTRIFENAKLDLEIMHTSVCAKDSRDVDESDRKNLLAAVEGSPHEHILVTHGTYTMPDSADYVAQRLRRKGQVVIFTGSMIPIDGFTFSDGPFNLGFAIAKLQYAAPGVYVAMNGQLFEAGNVAKLPSEGRFIKLFDLQ